MSHFVVFVAGPNIESQLEPFNEGKCVDFDDQTDEAIEEYAELSAERKAEYPTFDLYCEQYHGYSCVNGRWGYWHNNRAKWDWYVVGGRWTGMLRLKEGAAGELGEPGVFGNKPTRDADVARKCDIDIEGVRKEIGAEAAARYDKVAEVIGPADPNHVKWSDILAREQEKGTDIDDIRKMYHEQPAVKRFEEAAKTAKTDEDRGLFVWGSVDDFIVSRDEYIAREVRSAGVPFAFLINDEWHEHGSMGWFGCASNEKEDWPEQFWKLYDALPDDTLITVVDCHI